MALNFLDTVSRYRVLRENLNYRFCQLTVCAIYQEEIMINFLSQNITSEKKSLGPPNDYVGSMEFDRPGAMLQRGVFGVPDLGNLYAHYEGRPEVL